MATEAALLGTPVLINYFWTPISRFLKRKRLPIKYTPNLTTLLSEARKILKDPNKFRVDTSKIIEKMESPVQKSVECIKRCVHASHR